MNLERDLAFAKPIQFSPRTHEFATIDGHDQRDILHSYGAQCVLITFAINIALLRSERNIDHDKLKHMRHYFDRKKRIDSPLTLLYHPLQIQHTGGQKK